MTRVLFHGTSTGYLGQILRDGLDPRSSYKGYLCYADDLAIARWHADCMAEWDAGKLNKPCRPVVFAIPIGAFLPADFCLEENYIDLGPSAGRAVGRRLRHLLRSWRLVLAVAGAVGYRRRVLVDRAMILRSQRSTERHTSGS